MSSRAKFTCVLALALKTSFVLGADAGRLLGWGHAANLRTVGSWTPEVLVQAVAVAPDVLTNVLSVCSSSFFCLALKEDGTVFGWGSNHQRQALGRDTLDLGITNGFVMLGGSYLSNTAAVAAGSSFGLALKKDGTLESWGRFRVPAGVSNIISVAAGFMHALALNKDGTVMTFGRPEPSFVGVSNVVAISASRSSFWHDAVLTRTGKVLEQHPTEVVEVPARGHAHSKPVTISVGYNHSLALLEDGSVLGWGSNDGGQATGVPSSVGERTASPVSINGQAPTNIIAVSAGQEYSMALAADGKVLLWGNEQFFRPVPSFVTNVAAIEAGEGFCLVIQRSVTIKH